MITKTSFNMNMDMSSVSYLLDHTANGALLIWCEYHLGKRGYAWHYRAYDRGMITVTDHQPVITHDLILAVVTVHGTELLTKLIAAWPNGSALSP